MKYLVMLKRTLFFIFTFLISLSYTGQARADECWINTPSGYQGIGGASRIGPYSDYYEALGVNNSHFEGWGSIDCTKTEKRGSGSKFNYGAAKFHNNTSSIVTLKVRSSPGGSWENAQVSPGELHKPYRNSRHCLHNKWRYRTC